MSEIDSLRRALKRAADMLQSIAGDIEDGYALADMRGKYVLAVLGARDAAIDALKASAPHQIEEAGTADTALPRCGHLDTPLAAMAKAAWNTFWSEKDNWDTLDTHSKYMAIDSIRAALLALAECDWPKEVRQAAAADVTDDPMLHDLAGRMAEKSARALLNALARPPSSIDKTAPEDATG